MNFINLLAFDTNYIFLFVLILPIFVCLLVITFLVIEYLRERKEERRDRREKIYLNPVQPQYYNPQPPAAPAEPAPAPAPVEVVVKPTPVVVAPVAVAVAEPPVVKAPVEVAETPVEPKAVAEAPAGDTFSFTENRENYRERAEKLEEPFKRYSIELEEKAKSYPGAKPYGTRAYIDYKIGSKRIVRLTIKRDVLSCEFLIIDSDLQKYAKGNRDTVEAKPFVVKILDEASLKIAMDLMEMSHDNIKNKGKEEKK